MGAKRIIKKLHEAEDLDWEPEADDPDDSTARELAALPDKRETEELAMFKRRVCAYVKWLLYDEDLEGEGVDAEVGRADTFEQVQAILARYDTGGDDGFLALLQQGYL